MGIKTVIAKTGKTTTMTYDGFVLAAVAAELRKTVLRARVQRIRQHNATDLTLEVRGPGHTYLLFFSVDARFARVYLAAASLPVPKEPPNFRMLLSKYIEGAFITGVDQVGMDRVLRLGLDSSEHGKMVLILEIMGKHSNLILVDNDGKILGAAKNVGASISRYRQILPGREYIPPPATDKADVREIGAQAFDQLWAASLPEAVDSESVKKWLVNTFSGFGPFLADEIVARAAEGGLVHRDSARSEVLTLGKIVHTSSYAPVFISGDTGEGLMVYPIPSAHFPSDRQHPRESINEALDTLYRTLVSQTALNDEKTQLLTSIHRAQAARKQTLKSIDRTLAESEKAERYRQIGELLLANIHAIEKGTPSVMLADFFDPDLAEVKVELDEKLAPQQNAERYFKRFQKARDAVSTAESRKAVVIREISVLESSERDSQTADNVESLKALRKTLLSQDLLRAEIVQERHTEEFGGQRIRRLLTPEGWEILYGENSLANDYLTQRVAKPNDLWLHARSITGAHVVIRTAGHSGSVPTPVMHKAAKVAAANSDAKHSSLVPIDYTHRKYVHKPRGSAPGFVIYRNEKTIDVRPG